jgi:hypothetical protein
VVFHPSLDMADSLMLFMEELSSAALVLFVVATVVEGLIYRFFLQRSWRSAFRGSLIANFTSAVLGLVIGFLSVTFFIMIFAFGNYYLTLILTSFVASVLVEGAVITQLYKRNDRYMWGVVFVANLASYLITVIYIYIYLEM